MDVQVNKTQRIHALDSLRAIMMLLGIVLHSSISYWVTDIGFPKDPNSTHISNDIIAHFIHFFRMPTFFVVAGFFGAMLFYEKGLMQMLKNRVSRIALPFMVFILILYPTLRFSNIYSVEAFSGSDNPIATAAAYFSDAQAFLPSGTWHLWFLYYLILFAAVATIFSLVIKKLPIIGQFITQVFGWTIQKPIIRIFVFTGMTCVVYLVMGSSSIPHSTTFLPDIDALLFYFSFYLVGWVLFKSKNLLDSFKRFDGLTTIFGIVVFSVYVAIEVFEVINIEPYEDVFKIMLQSIIVWSLVFGVTGLFIRFASKHSSIMRYLSDASYWVYLLHYTLTIFISGLLFYWDAPSTIKLLTVMTSTTVICFVTYHYLVRSSFIGEFLNGRRYLRKSANL